MDGARAQAKLSQLAELDPGSVMKEIHGYKMNPPIKRDALSKVEGAYGLTLPKQYRRFLLEIGNGGAGPYGGILPLESSISRWKHMLATDDIGPVLCGKCPLTADVRARDILPIDVDNHDALMADESSGYYEKLQDAMIEQTRRLLRGTITICDYGCGDSFFLVLKGAQRGQVWGDNMGNYGGLFSLEVDLHTWYETWLDRTLAILQSKERPADEVRYFEYADPDVGRVKDLSGP